MAQFIDDEVLANVEEMIHEHLDEEKEEIDTLFGDEFENRNRKVTVNLRINLAAKDNGVEAKSTINYILEPSVPAKKKKGSKKRLIDKTQGKLFGDKAGA